MGQPAWLSSALKPGPLKKKWSGQQNRKALRLYHLRHKAQALRSLSLIVVFAVEYRVHLPVGSGQSQEFAHWLPTDHARETSCISSPCTDDAIEGERTSTDCELVKPSGLTCPGSIRGYLHKDRGRFGRPLCLWERRSELAPFGSPSRRRSARPA